MSILGLLVWLLGLIYELFFAIPCKHPHILVLGWEGCVLKNKIGLQERFYRKNETVPAFLYIAFTNVSRPL